MNIIGSATLIGLITRIILSGLFTFIAFLSMEYGIKNIPDDYGTWGSGCKDTKGMFIYNFFGMGGGFCFVFGGIWFVAMVGRLLIYLISNNPIMLIP